MYHGSMTETSEQRRARLTIASRKAASVRTEAAVSRYLANVPDERLASELVDRGYFVEPEVK